MDVLLHGGFSALVDQLDNNITVVTNTNVTSISQAETGSVGVEVATAAGDVYTAPHVIVTLSLGVLKEKSVRFTPALPEAKLLAIDEMVSCMMCLGGGILTPMGPSLNLTREGISRSSLRSALFLLGGGGWRWIGVRLT